MSSLKIEVIVWILIHPSCNSSICIKFNYEYGCRPRPTGRKYSGRWYINNDFLAFIYVPIYAMLYDNYQFKHQGLKSYEIDKEFEYLTSGEFEWHSAITDAIITHCHYWIFRKYCFNFLQWLNLTKKHKIIKILWNSSNSHAKYLIFFQQVSISNTDFLIHIPVSSSVKITYEIKFITTISNVFKYSGYTILL